MDPDMVLSSSLGLGDIPALATQVGTVEALTFGNAGPGLQHRPQPQWSRGPRHGHSTVAESGYDHCPSGSMALRYRHGPPSLVSARPSVVANALDMSIDPGCRRPQTLTWFSAAALTQTSP